MTRARREHECGSLTLPLPEPTVEGLRAAIAHLGAEPCSEHAPADDDEQVSGLLAGLLAMTQAQIQRRQRHADTIAVAYHAMRHNLDTFPACEHEHG